MKNPPKFTPAMLRSVTFSEVAVEVDVGDSKKNIGDAKLSDEAMRLLALRRAHILDTPPEPAFDQITRLASRLLGAPIALITLVDENRQWFKSSVGVSISETPRDIAFCAHTIQQDGVFVVNDAVTDERFASNPLVLGDPSVRFYAGAPLLSNDGMALGAVCVADVRPRAAFSEEDKQVLRDLSDLASAHIQARQSIGYLEPETGLPNRFRFLADLDAFLASSRTAWQEVAVVVIKVAAPGEYAEFIRTLGHGITDAFTVAASRRIEATLPQGCRIYHLSGARFAYVADASASSHFERDLLALSIMLDDPITIEGVPLSTSRGIGYSKNADGESGAELMRTATSAAHESLEGAQRFCRYSRNWDDARKRSFRLLRDLGSAIDHGDQFHIVYQPKVDLRSNQCVGVEALLRWVHPELGSVSPAEFVPLAERTDLVKSLTQWVINSTFSQAAKWHAAGLSLRTSINVSMLDLNDPRFATRVAEALSRWKINASSIGIEVTEGALMRDSATVTGEMHKLRALGIEIEIDDFGTGQSALSYLRQIPATFLKIDQSFVRRLDADVKDQIMVRSTIALAHDLGLSVVAEGVENMAVYKWLQQQGCDIGQGYSICRPLPADQLETWVALRADPAS